MTRLSSNLAKLQPGSSSRRVDTPPGENESTQTNSHSNPSISASSRTFATNTPKGHFGVTPGVDLDAAILADRGAIHDEAGSSTRRSVATTTVPVTFLPKSNLPYTVGREKRASGTREPQAEVVPTDPAVLALLAKIEKRGTSTSAKAEDEAEIPEVTTPGTTPPPPSTTTPDSPSGDLVVYARMSTTQQIIQQFLNMWYIFVSKRDELQRAGNSTATTSIVLALLACPLVLIAGISSTLIALTWPAAIGLATLGFTIRWAWRGVVKGFGRARDFVRSFLPWHIPRERIGLPLYGVYADISATVIAVPRSLVRFAKYYRSTAFKIAVVLMIWYTGVWVYGKAWEQGHAKCTNKPYRDNIGTFFFPIDAVPVSRGSGHITQRLSDLLRYTVCEVQDQFAWFGLGNGCAETKVSFYAWKNAHYGIGMDIMPWCLLAFIVPVFLRSARLFVFVGYWTVIIRSIVITSPSPDYGPCGFIVDDVLWPLASPWVIFFGVWQVVSSVASLWDMFRHRDPITDLVEGIIELKSTMYNSDNSSELEGDMVSDTDLRNVPAWALTGLIAVVLSPIDSTITTDKITYVSTQWKGRCSSSDPKEQQAREAWFVAHPVLVIECVRLFLTEKVAERVRQGLAMH